MNLSELHIYPVKSLRGIAPRQWDADRYGLAGDRRWMLVDENDRFVTQREAPRMALINTTMDDEHLVLRADGMPELELYREPPSGKVVKVDVWNDRVFALDSGDPPARILSDFLQRPVRLVHFPRGGERPVDPRFANPDDHIAFSDGFPFLLISQASLDDLNSRLADPLPMLRFRPNLVVSGCEPYEEDRWRRIRIGAMEFRVVKPCSRCVITTIDPASAEKGAEPLRTLGQYRRRGDQVYFGQNLLHDGPGSLKLGDTVEVLEYAAE